MGQTLSGTKTQWNKNTLDGTNIEWDENWLGQNSKWENNESIRHRVGQKSSKKNIEWDKHQVKQTLGW